MEGHYSHNARRDFEKLQVSPTLLVTLYVGLFHHKFGQSEGRVR